jgi:TolA-binding protein
LKLVELSLSLTNSSGAVRHLETFITQFPKDPAADQALLSLGELRLKEYRTLRESAGKTNQQLLSASAAALQQAVTNLNLLVASTNFASSPLLGLAQLNLGWCYWEADKVPESLGAFKDAAEKLPPSTNQALARLKWAECQFRSKDYSNALQNCRAIVSQYGAERGFPKPLLERTLYEIVRASTSLVQAHLAEATATTSLAQTNLTEASAAMDRILAEFPHSEFLDRGLLLVGQLLNRLGNTAEAREKFERLLKDVPNSTLIPEAKLAIARTYAKAREWPLAIGHYDDWVGHYTNHEDLAKVEFERAWANDQGGNETNALRLFTNFVARFPQSPLWPQAQYWVGDYYYNLGRLGDQTNFAEAEQNYQRLYDKTNFPINELTYQARLAAGRAAYAGQRLNNAIPDFTELINRLLKDTNSPPELLSEALIALGDTYRSQPSSDPTNTLKNLGEAIRAYSRVAPGDRLRPRAWALIADCHLQLALKDPGRYASAASNYLNVITINTNSVHADADVETRSNAEFGLASVLEKQAEGKSGAEREALLQQAWDHYANVAYRKNLLRGEKPDPYWMAKAGLEAGRILEDQKKWPQAVALYQRLLAELPSSLAGRLQKKLDQATDQSKRHLDQ